MAAGSAVIGALRVVLGADTAALEKGLKDAGRSLDRFATGLASSLKVATVGLAAAAGAMAVSIKGAVNEADELGKLAQKIGIPVEDLSALKHAADLSGVSLEALGKGVARLSKNMVDAAAKPTSEAANAFRALGLSATNTDGSLKSSSQVLTDIAGKFENMKDGAGKTAVSMALFGKAGVDLIPMLNAGKAGLADMIDEAQRFGLVIDTKTAKSAEAFNDNLTKLSAVMRGGIIQLMSGMAGSLENISTQALALTRSGDLKAWGENIGQSFVWVTEQLQYLSLGLTRFAVEWEAFKTLFTVVPFTEASRKAWADFAAAGDETKRKFSELGQTMAAVALIAGGALGTVITATANSAKTQADFNYAAMAGKSALDSFIASQNKHIVSTIAQISTVGQSVFALEHLKTVQEGLAIASANNIAPTDAMRQKLQELGVAAGEAALRLQGQQLVQGVTPMWERYQADIENTKNAMLSVNATGEQIAAAQEKNAERYGLSWKQQVPSIVGSFSEIAGAFGQENAKMAKAAQVLGAVQALISTYAGQAEALKLPFPLNFAAMAAIAAKGFGLVAAIKSTSVPKMAEGGRVAGPGSGTSDSIRAWLSNGEFVVNAKATRDNLPLLEAINAGAFQAREFGRMMVPKLADGGLVDAVSRADREFPGPVLPAASNSPPSRTVIELNGFGRSSEVWPRANVIQLVDALNEVIKDGYVIERR